ncbi:receptor-type tyrosine-protein phosphatase beta-like [Ptychodera flava]|uniref:receptor-type tyrosine-protein phosphatase beta-like n=1 Tax=Ptychodera flava TaxID=63121 RepID=UPI003969DD90
MNPSPPIWPKKLISPLALASAEQNDQDGEESVEDTQRREGTVEDLTPGAEYMNIVTAYHTNGMESPSDSETQRTKPEAPEDVIISSYDTTTITVEWTIKSDTVYDRFEIFYTDESTSSTQTKQVNDKSIRSAELTGLVAGESYYIYMRSYSVNEVSELSTTVTQRTRPEAPEDVVISSYDTTTIIVEWTIESDTVYDRFEIFYTDESTSSTQTKQVNDKSIRSAELTGLVSGESYDISMRSFSVNKVSENSTTVTQRTKPEAPEDLVISSYDTTTITVEWTIKSDTVYDRFEIFYTDESTSSTQTKQVNDKSIRSAELTGLVAGESYYIYMRSYSVNEVSEHSTTVTQRTRPEAPEDVVISSYDTTIITVEWTMERDTVYDGFEIFYTDKSTSSTQTKQVNDKSKRSTELTGLVAGESYDIYMRSYSVNEVSENSTTVTQRTIPATPEHFRVTNTTVTSLLVEWDKPMGNFETYIINVDFVNEERDKTLDNIHIPLPDKHDENPASNITRLDPFTEYQVTLTCVSSEPSKTESVPTYTKDETDIAHDKNLREQSTSSIFITMGENAECDVGDSENYCNGPLKTGTLYRDSSLAGNENPMPVIEKEQEGSRKKKRKHSNPVKFSKYEDYFNTMSADMDFLFSEEYGELRDVGRDQTCDVSDLPNNRGKNRYSNIVPYDRTRVLLSIQGDDETSDYINANWIPGNNSPKEFIATQGPMPETKDDFWRMIWEYNVKTIVMVTQCTERGKVKCDHYWPSDNKPAHYGSIKVNVVSEEVFSEWTLRALHLENGAISKRVRHFNFTALEDHAVPGATITFLHFISAVREQIPDDNTPVVVHCSSGVGRTGTFIALDRLIQHMRDNDYVDIYGIACEMRMHRMFMIQTESQYVFIHQCVADLLREEVGRGEDNFPPRLILSNLLTLSDMVLVDDGRVGDEADENRATDRLSGETRIGLRDENADNYSLLPSDQHVYEEINDDQKSSRIDD